MFVICHLLHNAWLGRVNFTAILEDPYMEIKPKEGARSPHTLLFITPLSKTYPTNKGKIQQVSQHRNSPDEAYDHWKEAPTCEEKALECRYRLIYH